MISNLFELYAMVFARPFFLKLNKFLLNISLRGLGVLNYRTEALRGEFDWLSSYLSTKSSPLVIDVGANVGNYSKDVLKINDSARVVSIEPHPVNFIKLKSNPELEGVLFHNLAVGEKLGELELFDYANNDGSSHASLFKEVITDLHKGNAVSHKVEVKPLSQIVELLDSERISLLKIDTEGNELNVLIGSKDILSRIDAIHLEFNEMNIISRTFFKDIWDLLNNDFYFYRILPKGKLLPIPTYSSVFCEIFHFQNIVCIRK